MAAHFQAHTALLAVVLLGGTAALQRSAVHAVDGAACFALVQQVDFLWAQSGLTGQGMQGPEVGFVAAEEELQTHAGASQDLQQGRPGLLRIRQQHLQGVTTEAQAFGEGRAPTGSSTCCNSTT